MGLLIPERQLRAGSPNADSGRSAPGRGRRWLSLVVLVLVAVLAPRPAPAGERGAGQEYDVKAVFLHHFTRYVRWPAPPAGDTFEIVVFGPSDIVAPLKQIASRKSVENRKIVVRQVSAVAEIGHPRILFVPRESKVPLPEILKSVRAAPVLTVAEQEGAAKRGAAIGFVTRGSSIRFEVNERSLREARLVAGAQLLEIGIRVDDRTEGAE